VSVVRFKFRCNILIRGKIIKEIPGSVASGTHCIFTSGCVTHSQASSEADIFKIGAECIKLQHISNHGEVNVNVPN